MGTIGALSSTGRQGRGVVDRGAAARYVLGRRTPDGGYSFYRTPSWGVEEPNAPDTLAALESLRVVGVDVPEPRETTGWLRSLQDHEGGFATLTIGWAALRALDVLRATPPLSPEGWLHRVVETVSRPDVERSWRGALVDALHLLEIDELAFVGRPLATSFVAGLLEAAREPDGGWARPGADLATTAVAMRLAHLAHLDAGEQDVAARYVQRCEDASLGLRLSPDAAATSAGALCGGLTILGSTGLSGRFLGAVARQLVLLQGSDGGFAARHRGLSTLQDTWRGLEAARLLEELLEARP